MSSEVSKYFESRIIKTDVTSVEIILNFIFAGIGNVVHILNITDQTCQYFPILHRQRIHGFRFHSDLSFVVVYGNREIVVASLDINEKISLTVVSRWIVGDWIWDVKWTKKPDELIILTANNVVSEWNWKLRKINRTIKCYDKCLLYCGIILGTKWYDAVVICGTMFKSILIWAPSDGANDSCNALHKLPGHKGAIFSVFYHEKSRRICSTSDDRSTRIWFVDFPNDTAAVVDSWKRAKIIPLFSVFGHMSRVWKSIMLSDVRFISAGEDSQLRVWAENGEPVISWETHQGASIRCVDVCEKLNVIVTGGKDSGISVWPLSSDIQSVEISLNHETDSKSSVLPRRLILTKYENLLTTTQKGTLLLLCNEKWNEVHSDDRFASYCLLEISPCKTRICLASLTGHVKILEVSKFKSSLSVIFDNCICSGKIFSLQWLSEKSFITCCVDGKLEVWDLNFHAGSCTVQKINNHLLPHCKERWLTSAAKFPHGIVAGDRDGSIHVFLNDLLPCQTFRRVHGRLGVSWISCNGNDEICSIGRDGFIRYWRFDKKTLIHSAADKLPVKWPVRVLSTLSYGLLILGFNEINFEVWNVTERKQIFSHKCGGGHRPWDFVLDECALFVYIREKKICRVYLPSNQLVKSSYLEGFHIRDVDCIRFLSKNIIISGGEDTTLRLSRINAITRSFEPLKIIRSHISSIRAITFLQIDDFFLTVSAGGRAQLKVWKFEISADLVKYSELASHMLKPSSKCRKPWMNMIHTFELEPRHMDAIIQRVSEFDFVIYTAGSDAFWRIYTFNMSTRSLNLLKEVEYSNYCLLKMALVNWQCQNFLITLATDGRATFWNLSDYSVLHQQSLHQGGINGYDYTILYDCLFFVTGGDDASLIAILFERVNEEIQMIAQWKNSSIHEAQISGVRIVKNFIISTGADQKIALWQWKVLKNVIEIDLKTFYHTFVPDIHGLEITACSENICVFGSGIELISLTL